MNYPSYNTLVGKLIRLPLNLVPKRAILRILGGLGAGFKWRAGSSTHGCWLGIYEREKQDCLAKRVKRGNVVFDIGANAGFYTLLFSRLVGPQGKVFAFEPLPENGANLLLHLKINDLSNVVFCSLAVGPKNDLSSFATSSSNAMGSLVRAETRFRVPTFSLDDLVYGQNFPSPDVIKMDVEGAEGGVLDGAQRLLGHKQTTFFIALHSQEQRQRCCTQLQKFGYEISDLHGSVLNGDDFETDEIVAIPPGVAK